MQGGPFYFLILGYSNTVELFRSSNSTAGSITVTIYLKKLKANNGNMLQDQQREYFHMVSHTKINASLNAVVLKGTVP